MFYYSKTVLEYFQQPQNVGELDEADIQVGTGICGSRAQGYCLKLQIQVIDEVIIAAKFKAYGCVSTIAVGSFLTEWLTQKNLREAVELLHQDIVKRMDLDSKKIHCALLAEDALKAAISNLKEKQGK